METTKEKMTNDHGERSYFTNSQIKITVCYFFIYPISKGGVAVYKHRYNPGLVRSINYCHLQTIKVT